MTAAGGAGRADEEQKRHNEASMSLGNWLSEQIAAVDGVDAREVTEEYIQNQREQRLYKDAVYSTSSRYGGYNVNGLVILSRRQLEERDHLIELEMSGG